MVHRRRLLTLIGVGFAGYGALIARAVQLQALDASWLAERATRQHQSKVRLEPLRGELRDRNGVLLAGSAEVESVAASPRALRDPEAAARALSSALGVPLDEIRARLTGARSFAWLKRWVSPEGAESVRALGLRGVHLHPERKRFYPSRELAATLLGFAGRDGHGLAGVELAFDAALSGRSAQLPALRDARGRRLVQVGAGPERTGSSLVLALDARLQHRAEQVLERALERTGARHGSLVALDPWTGDVLAAAEAPGFDPNHFWRAEPARYRARALVDAFEPGSTLKPFTIALALEAGVVRPEQRFDCEDGEWQVADRRLRDWKRYGVLSVRDIVRLSSNIGAAKIAARLGSKALVGGLRDLGFGSRPGSGFPGEAAGALHDLGRDQVVERANLAFGQGLLVSALQLARAGAVLATDGLSVRPRLALAIERGGERIELPPSRTPPVLSARTARTVRAMMEQVVESGTGRRAALPGHRVAGKTGTAQKAVAGRYSQERFVASFLGIVPANEPRLVVVVVLDEPRRGEHTGGSAAAPAFRELAEFAVERLGIPGDRQA